MISLILPVYDVEQYLRQCLDSIVSQTYQNLEIICINDGSPDNCLQILREYESRDTRFVIIDKKNEGVAIARNEAIQIAKGKYIMFADGDDWLEPNMCEKAVTTIEESQADVVMFSYFREYEGRTLKKTDIFPYEYHVFEGNECHTLYRGFAGMIAQELKHPENFDALCALWQNIYRADIMKAHPEIRYIDNKIIGTYGDGLMNMFYFKYVRKAVFISDCLYHYRKTNESSIVTKYKKNFPERWNNMFDVIENYIVDNNLGDDFKEGLSNRIAFSILGLGYNELHARTNVLSHIKAIKGLLSKTRYRNAITSMNMTYLPFHWKVFFNACKRKDALVVYILLQAIEYLKKVK